MLSKAEALQGVTARIAEVPMNPLRVMDFDVLFFIISYL